MKITNGSTVTNFFADWDPDDLELQFLEGKKRPDMAKFNIEVVGITGPSFVKTPRGGYNALEVAYKKDGKIEGKKLVDFANPAVFQTMKNAKSGQTFAVTAEKDDNNFWQWTGVSEADASEQTGTETNQAVGGSETGDTPTPSKNTGGRGKVTGSNYETPDERAIRRAFDVTKHRQIGRQGCINSAINYMNANFKEVTVEDIIETAKKFEEFVFAKVE